MDLQEFDWNDVKQVRGPRISSVRLTGPITVHGKLRITENKAIVTNGADQQVFNRDRVFAIVTKAEKRVKLWSGKMSFGFNFYEGNTDDMHYSAKANLKRHTSETRFVMDYLGNITQTNSVETVNNHRVHKILMMYLRLGRSFTALFLTRFIEIRSKILRPVFFLE